MFFMLVSSDASGSKMVGFSSQYIYRAHYTAKTFDDAEATCVENNGHLLTVADGRTMLLVDGLLFDQDALDGSEFDVFWIGLRWENQRWVFEGGNPSFWDGPSTYSYWDDDPLPEDGKHCVGLKFVSKLGFRWHREDCSEKKAFICMELVPKCLPTFQAEDGSRQTIQVSKNNYGCPNRKPDMIKVENDCECNTTYEIRHPLPGEACDDQYATDNVVCLPGCPVPHVAVPDDAILLDRDQIYHEGHRVAYYCPGVFEYHGDIYPHNLIELPCRADEPYSQTAKHLFCHRFDSDHLNKEVKTIHASLDYNYKLHCGHKGSSNLPHITKFVWFHGGIVVDENMPAIFKVHENGDLEIRSVSQELIGTYFCVAKYGNTYLPGNSYNISIEHHEATDAAIRKWNAYDSMYLGYFHDPVNNTYYSHVAYFEKKTFAEARSSCEAAAAGGRLALVAGVKSQKVLDNLYSPEMMKNNYQFRDRSEEYPEKFWSGMLLNLAHHSEWMDLAGHRDDMLTWRAGDKGSNHEGSCGAIKLHQNVSFRGNDQLSMRAVNCEEKLPYVCTFPAQQCLPHSVAKAHHDDSANYRCSNNTINLAKIKTDGCECDATKVKPETHQSCTKINAWSTTLCVPECQPNPEYGAIVYPEKKYFFGMYMTYFCPGHFEINGIEYNHNSLALKCDPARQEVINLQCRREKLLSENALVEVKKLNPVTDLKDDSVLLLKCNHPSSHLQQAIWMIKDENNIDVWKEEQLESVKGNISLLTGPTFATGDNWDVLRIKHVDESVRGVYGCYFELYSDRRGKEEPEGLGILLPGNVYKIMFEGDDDDEAEDKIVTSASSLMVPWQQTGIYVHHFAMLLLLLAIVL